MLTEQQINQFLTAISSFHWRTNYYQFCEILNLNPEHQYSKDKWKQFQELNKSLQYFDLNSLTLMIEASQKTTV